MNTDNSDRGKMPSLELDITKLINDWLEYEQKANNASQNTIRTYERSFNIFLDWLDIDFQSVTPTDIINFKSDLSNDYSNQTVNLYLTAVRSFYRFCVTKEYISVNPAREVKGAKRDKVYFHKREALTNDEIKSLLEQPDTSTLIGLRDKAILTLMLFCALRTIEIHRANLEDMKPRNNRLTLEIKGKGKSSKSEYVVIPVNQESVIKHYLRKRYGLGNKGALFVSLSNRSKCDRMALSSLRSLIKGYFKQAGITDDRKTSHSLRHTAISSAIRNGATALQAQNLGRHSDFNTTLIYIHETDRIDKPPEDLIDYE